MSCLATVPGEEDGLHEAMANATDPNGGIASNCTADSGLCTYAEGNICVDVSVG